MKKFLKLLTKERSIRILVIIFLFLMLGLVLFQNAEAANTNLLINPSVETAKAGNPNLPKSWFKNHYANTSVFTYPVTGFNSAKAVKVQVTVYNADEEGWYPNDVNITAGKTYTFSDTYISDVKSYVTARFWRADNSFIDSAPQEVPLSVVWAQTSLDFTAPASTVSMTVFHSLKSTGTLTTDVYSLIEKSAPSPTPSPTPVPTPSPTPVATPSPTPKPTATPTPLPTVTPTPTPVPTATPAPSSSPNPANLVLNPSVESGPTNTPTNWHSNSWGTNTAQFTYPSEASDGSRGLKVAMTSYTDGDAKWYFDDVSVVQGKQYQYSNYYKSTIQTKVVVQYTLSDGAATYSDLGQVSPSSSWQKFSVTLLPPSTAVSMTIFHLIAGVGTLNTDNYSLSTLADGPTADSFDQGYVSITLDDGWDSHYSNALPILNQASLKGTFYIISGNTITPDHANLILNNSLEATDSANPSLPANWHTGNWGSNTAEFTYPSEASDGSKGAQVKISNYVDGDAKWYFDDVSVAASTKYTFSDRYKADVGSTFVVKYNKSDGTTEYQDMINLPASSGFRQLSAVITTPALTTSLSIYHLLRANGTLTVDNFHLEKQDSYLSPNQVYQLQADGHEVGDHTRTHPDLTTLSQADATTEISRARIELQSLGLSPVDTLAYPYGTYNSSIIQIAKDAGLVGARSVEAGFNTKTANKYALKAEDVNVTTTPTDIKVWVDAAVANKTWLNLMFHQIDESGSEFSTTPANFQAVVDYIKSKGIKVITVHEGLAKF